MEQRNQRLVRKMLEVEGEEIVVLRLYEKRKRKMASQMRLNVIVIFVNP
jgi:outer membrane protein assembly factor BamD (BamD/ComL family)